jgi:hypothetical protein
LTISYHDKRFVGVVNYDDADLTKEVRFHYRQNGRTVWGTFEGGRVRFGTLVADVLDGDQLEMVWQYLNVDGEFVGGTCRSVPELLPDGRLRLHESWTVIGGESGTSVIEEVA